ncbi:MAG: leucine-rich repeat protein [Lachnospiraceae bacterium]|nr:leucine-rich repeat protein [Lachnospiraceae bacterium]
MKQGKLFWKEIMSVVMTIVLIMGMFFFVPGNKEVLAEAPDSTISPTVIKMEDDKLMLGDKEWNVDGSYLKIPAGEYILMSDITTSASIYVDNAVTINLNGYGIRYSGSDNASVFYIRNGKQCFLTINDSEKSRIHYVTLMNGRGKIVSSSGVESATCLKVLGGYITGGTGIISGKQIRGGCIYIDSSGKLTMNGGTILGNTANYGAGVYSYYNTTINMNGTKVMANTASSYIESDIIYAGSGGGLYALGNFNINNSIITGNSANSQGGGIYAFGGSSATSTYVNYNLKDCVITGNYARSEGGGIYVTAYGQLTIDSGEISGNVTEFRGGGVYYHGALCTLNIKGNPMICNNICGGANSNIYVNEGYITVAGELTNETPIGVEKYRIGRIITGLKGKGSDKNFVSDNADYTVILNDENEAEYKKKIKEEMIQEIEAQTYTGTALEPDVTLKDGDAVLTKDTDYTVEYSDNINTGTATVTVTGIGKFVGTASKTFTINKAKNPVIIKKDINATRGASIDLSQFVTEAQGDVSFSLSDETEGYSLSGEGNKILTLAADAVSSCQINVSATGNSNYEPKNDGIMIVTATDKLAQNLSFAELEKNVTFGDTAFINKLSGSNTEVTYSITPDNVAKINEDTGEVSILGIGKATVTANAAETDTYAAATISYPLTVNTKYVEYPTAKSNLKYDGQEHSGIEDSIDKDYYTLSGELTGTDAKSYVATAVLKDKTNTKWTPGRVSDRNISWSIAKADAAPAPTNLKGVAPTSTDGTDGKITGVNSTMQWANNYNFNDAKDCEGTEITGLAAGSYYVRVKGDENHYDGTKALVKVPAFVPTYTLAITVPVFDNEIYSYSQPTAKPITITSTGNSDSTISSVALDTKGAEYFTLNKTDGTTVEKGTTDNTTYTVCPKSGLTVGTYTATITVTYDNDATATADVSFTVVPKEVKAPTITLSSDTIVYDGSEKKPAVISVKDGDNVIPAGEYTVSYSDNINAGTDTATVTITDKDGGNYTVSGSQTFSIDPADMIVEAEGFSGPCDEKPHGITVRVIKPTSGYVIKYMDINGEYTLDESPTMTYYGSLPYSYQVTAPNYKTVKGSKTVEILQADNPVVIPASVTVKRGTQIYLDDLISNPKGTLKYTIQGEAKGYSFDENNNSILKLSEDADDSCVIKVENSGNGSYKPKDGTITIYATNLNVQTISFTESEIEKTYGDDEFSIKPNQTVENSPITYSISCDPEGVATIDKNTGVVTILKIGTAIITATAAETTTHTSAVASYKLTVNTRLIDIPTAVSDLTYDGSEKKGVIESKYYTLSGVYKATNAAESYIATVSLKDTNNTKWSDNTTDSKDIEWNIAKANAVSAPTGLLAVCPTVDSNDNGKITGVTTDMEYSTNGVDYISCIGSEITGLTPGKYYVRVKKDDNHLAAGETCEITVPEFSNDPKPSKEEPTPKTTQTEPTIPAEPKPITPEPSVVPVKTEVTEIPKEEPKEEPKVDTAIKEEGTTIKVADTKAEVKVTSSDKDNPTVVYTGTTEKKATSIKIPATVNVDGVTYKITEVSKKAFANNKTVKTVTLGENIEKVGEQAFAGCTALKTVKIPATVTELGKNAFAGCKKLTNITIAEPKKNDKKAKDRTLVIGDYAFANCPKLKTVTLPENVVKLGNYIFKGDNALTTINIKTTKLTNKNVAKKAFNGVLKKTVVKVNKSKLKAYTVLFRKKGLIKKVKIKVIK